MSFPKIKKPGWTARDSIKAAEMNQLQANICDSFNLRSNATNVCEAAVIFQGGTNVFNTQTALNGPTSFSNSSTEFATPFVANAHCVFNQGFDFEGKLHSSAYTIGSIKALTNANTYDIYIVHDGNYTDQFFYCYDAADTTSAELFPYVLQSNALTGRFKLINYKAYPKEIIFKTGMENVGLISTSTNNIIPVFVNGGDTLKLYKNTHWNAGSYGSSLDIKFQFTGAGAWAGESIIGNTLRLKLVSNTGSTHWSRAYTYLPNRGAAKVSAIDWSDAFEHISITDQSYFSVYFVMGTATIVNGTPTQIEEDTFWNACNIPYSQQNYVDPRTGANIVWNLTFNSTTR